MIIRTFAMSTRLDYLFGEDGKPVASNYADIEFQDHSCRILEEIIQKFEIVSMTVTSPGVFRYVTLKFRGVNYKVNDYIELMGDLQLFVPIVMLNVSIRDRLRAVDVKGEFVLELNCALFFDEIPIEKSSLWVDFISKKVRKTFGMQIRNDDIREFLTVKSRLMQEIKDLYTAAAVLEERSEDSVCEDEFRVLMTTIDSVLSSIDAKQEELAIRQSVILEVYPNIWI